MSDLDQLTSELRTQMRAATAGDTAPGDLLHRVQRGADRGARRRAVAGCALALSGVLAATTLLMGTTGDRPELTAAAGGPATSTSTASAPSAPAGPSDDELRAAEWFTYSSRAEQPGSPAEQRSEQRWASRDGRHVALQPDGSLAVYSTDSRFPYGERGLSFDEVLALPADPGALEAGLPGPNGWGADSNVVDSAQQLLAHSPMLLPVRRAVVDVVAALPGTQRVEGKTDSLGRAATLLRFRHPGGSDILLFVDPTTARLIEHEEVVGSGGLVQPTEAPVPATDQAEAATPRPGDLLYRETYLDWGTTAPPSGG